MKKLAYALTALVLVLSIVQGCKKSSSLKPNTSQPGNIKSSLKVNQPDSIVFAAAPSTDSVHWIITPSGFNSLRTKGNKAVFSFIKSGTYTVKGIADNTDSVKTTIKVNDSVYNPPHYAYVPLTGDEIRLTPNFYIDKKADTSYIFFTAQTTNTYCGNGKLEMAYSLYDNTYTLNFLNVMQPDPCTAGGSILFGYIYYTTNPSAPLANGNYPLIITLNGTTYTGSITVTSAAITFNWNYTSGVVLMRKQITR